jgi:transposase
MQSLHRSRSRLVGERTALINQLRAVLLERGITVAQGRHRLQRYLALAALYRAYPDSWGNSAVPVKTALQNLRLLLVFRPDDAAARRLNSPSKFDPEKVTVAFAEVYSATRSTQK